VLFNVVKFAFLAGLIFLAAWVAGTGRVAYTLIMLVVAGALAYAVVDLLDYEMVKRRKRILTTGPDRERSRGSA
jgi:hypothetical protein